MKRIIAGLLAASIAGAASAQEPSPTWNYSGIVGNTTVAWAIQTPGSPGKLPVIMLSMDNHTPGKVHSAQIATLEIDCAKRTVRPITVDTYDAYFVKTNTQAGSTGHAPFSGAMTSSLEAFCASRSQATRQANAIDALRWLDGYQPGSVAEPQPPSGPNLSFELAGRGSDTQRIDSWLETTSIAKTDSNAKAWVFEAWQSGWQSGTRTNFSPATWRHYEFDCQATIRYREVWFEQLDPKLAKYSVRTTNASLSVASDPTIKQIAMRVCSNRAMLFSEKFKGSDKELAASWYGASAQVGVAAKPTGKAPVTPVDLGPTIRMTIDDNGYRYTGLFTRQSPASKIYVGSFAADTNTVSRIDDTLTVIGIRNGMLEIDSDFRKGPYAIPVANGKVSGKGTVYPERANDKWSWTLVEPATIASSAPAPATPAAPVAPKPAPAPAAPAAADTGSYALAANRSLVWRQHIRTERESSAWADGAARLGGKPLLHIVNHMTFDSTHSGVPGPFRISVATIEYDCVAKTYRGVYAAYHDRDGKLLGSSFNGWGPVRFDIAHPLGPALQARCAGAAPPAGDAFTGNYIATATEWLSSRH